MLDCERYHRQVEELGQWQLSKKVRNSLLRRNRRLRCKQCFIKVGVTAMRTWIRAGRDLWQDDCHSVGGEKRE